MAKFSKGDKVESVKTGAKGVVDEVYGDEKYAVLFDGAASPDRVEGFQIKAANGCAKNAKDAFGAEVKVGDTVKFATGAYRGLTGKVKKIDIRGGRLTDTATVSTHEHGDVEEALVRIKVFNSRAPRSSNAVVQNAINARRARNAGDLSAPFQAALSAVRKLAEAAKKISPDHEVYKDAVKAGTALLRVKPSW